MNDMRLNMKFHFADIIRKIGDLHCLQRNDMFRVGIETCRREVRGKAKYIDVTCEVPNHIH